MKSIVKLLLFVSFAANAQPGKEAWNWVMGSGSLFNFSTGVPVQTPFTGQTISRMVSISDPNTGQLLFYANGTTVWDKNNNPMPNGNISDAIEHIIAIPAPCSNKYYLIVLNYNKSIYYSIVDMSLRGGLGDITSKNVPLPNFPYLPKGDGVRHTNQRDYWFITHGDNSNTFYAYLINQNGISSTPVISNVGSVLLTNYTYTNTPVTISYSLKASPNGKRLALAHEDGSNNRIIEIYNFDNATGLITNPITLNSSQFWHDSYWLSFSPDNTKLYATFAYYSTFSISQFDLSSNNAATIQASEYDGYI